MTRDEIAELNSKRVKTFLTIDELRAEDDLPPLPDGKGEIILDPTWLQFAQGKDMAEQGEEEGAMGEGEEEMDFESLLAQAGGGEEDEGGEEPEEEPEEETKKSWIVKL